VRKKSVKNSQPFVKKMKNVRTPRGGIFRLTLYTQSQTCSILSINIDLWLCKPIQNL